jgi:hypothetical protein
MKRAILVLLALSVVGLSLAFAAADGHVVVTRGKTILTHSTTVPLEHSRFLIGGELRSSQDFCKLQRTVRVTAHFPDGAKKLIGADVVSIGRGRFPGDFNAAWAISANLTGVDRLKAKVRKEVVRGLTIRNRHTRKIRVVCRRAVVVFAAPAS